MNSPRIIITLIATTILSIGVINAQDVIHKVENVTILDLKGKPAQIPYWGEKNLMLFYVDPDRANQNQELTDELERSKRAEGKNLIGLGIINLKDAPFIPNQLARAMAYKRTEKNKAIVLSDENNILSSEWELGDCNNKFVSMIINRDGELVYIKKGEFTLEEWEEFLVVIDNHK